MGKIIDMTLPVYHGAPTMPLDPKCAVIAHHTLESMKYNITQLIISTHHGTHLDAPFHFFNDGITVDKLDLGKCVGPAEVLDFTGVSPRHSLTVKDFQPYKSRVNENARLILRTNWWRRFPKKEYFSDGPMISPELARWLAKKKIALLGIETPGVHPVEWEKVHQILLGARIVVVEGLAHTNKLKKKKVFFIAAPLKLKGRDGSPIRAMAIENLESYR
ncbi:MAG: cyclase family protein [Sedimentisphaerales bacterium]|nr:cyclase family protein [Sedimentisphaerales bacterium]